MPAPTAAASTPASPSRSSPTSRGIVARLEATIAQRQSDVAAAMSDFQADGVDDQYRTVETRWNNAATQVQQIIDAGQDHDGPRTTTRRPTLTRARRRRRRIG